ncbi:dethiobiotin synthase [Marmoricola sp. RAF53]|uniref:dethiobiotin synthase n=1 Tax=Marmoricola sp. RAF53 TaxID=3233059 RepID=UPI003F9916C3
MKITIVTGTDTDVGKTVTTAALAAGSEKIGRAVFVMKPVQTGLISEPGDIAEIQRLIGPVPSRVGAELREALAPRVAARWEGVSLPELAVHVRDIVRCARAFDDLFVEGAGGLRVALGDAFDLLDLADEVLGSGFECEFVVVTRSGLGTLNHTILTVDAIRDRGHRVRGLVIGSLPPTLDLAQQSNLCELPRLTGVPLLGLIPEGASRLSSDDFRREASNWFVEGTVT